MVSLSWNLVLRLIQIWWIQWRCSCFLFSTGSILFCGIASKNKNCLLKLKFRTSTACTCLFKSEIPLVQNLKSFIKAEIWYLDYFEYVKFDGDIHLFWAFSLARFVQKISLGFWYYLINLPALYLQRPEASGFSGFSADIVLDSLYTQKGLESVTTPYS